MIDVANVALTLSPNLLGEARSLSAETGIGPTRTILNCAFRSFLEGEPDFSTFDQYFSGVRCFYAEDAKNPERLAVLARVDQSISIIGVKPIVYGHLEAGDCFESFIAVPKGDFLLTIFNENERQKYVRVPSTKIENFLRRMMDGYFSEICREEGFAKLRNEKNNPEKELQRQNVKVLDLEPFEGDFEFKRHTTIIDGKKFIFQPRVIENIFNHMLGMSSDEVATAMGISVSTVKNVYGECMKNCPITLFELFDQLCFEKAIDIRFFITKLKEYLGDTEVPELTENESEILQHIVKGARNCEICHAMGVTEKTTKHNVSSMLKKWLVSSRVALIGRGILVGHPATQLRMPNQATTDKPAPADANKSELTELSAEVVTVS